jgi:hypothetical protein
MYCTSLSHTDYSVQPLCGKCEGVRYCIKSIPTSETVRMYGVNHHTGKVPRFVTIGRCLQGGTCTCSERIKGTFMFAVDGVPYSDAQG